MSEMCSRCQANLATGDYGGLCWRCEELYNLAIEPEPEELLTELKTIIEKVWNSQDTFGMFLDRAAKMVATYYKQKLAEKESVK